MSTVTAGRATKGLLVLLTWPTTVISYFILVPLAAWNRNAVLLAIALALPFLVVQGLRRVKGINYIAKPKSGSRLNGILALAVIIFLLWNHMIFLTILFFVVMAVRNSFLKKGRRR
jgi:hypothetical protein